MKREYTEIGNHPFVIELVKEIAKFLKKDFKRRDFDYNHLLDLLGWGTKESKSRKKIQKKTPIINRFLSEIFGRIMEIDQCLKFLRYDIYRVKNISSDYRFGVGKRLRKEQYFYFYLYHFLEETYTIKERMTKLLATMKNYLKEHRHNSREANYSFKELDRLSKVFIETMKFVTDHRRNQKHDMNIEIEEIEQFSRAEFFITNMKQLDKETEFMMSCLTSKNYEQAQRKCLKIMRDYNKIIREILTTLFDQFGAIVFNEMQTILKKNC